MQGVCEAQLPGKKGPALNLQLLIWSAAGTARANSGGDVAALPGRAKWVPCHTDGHT